MTDYLTLRKLASDTGLGVRTLRRLLHDPFDPLPHYRVGRKFMVKTSDFAAWMERRRQRHESIREMVERDLKELRL